MGLALSLSNALFTFSFVVILLEKIIYSHSKNVTQKTFILFPQHEER